MKSLLPTAKDLVKDNKPLKGDILPKYSDSLQVTNNKNINKILNRNIKLLFEKYKVKFMTL